MELGNKIKRLRLRAGMTQEMLAEEMGVSFQTISKWENNVCAPDIAMLPKLSVYFGVTIDELFDLTVEQRLHRIENMLDMEQELPHSTFVETIEFLQDQLKGEGDKARIYSFLAHAYHHRINSDCEKVSRYARKSLLLRQDVKDCHWLLQKSEGAVVYDWNSYNHHRVILFYKDLVEKNPKIPRNYLYLMDNLLADRRIEEAEECLERYRSLEDHRAFQVLIYEGRIAWAKHDDALAEQKFQELEERFPEDGDVLFNIAGFCAERCQYDQAIAYYEKSFDLEQKQQKKPLYTDALEGMAIIHEIQGNYREAVKCYDRILQVLDVEFGFAEGAPVDEVLAEKQRLMEKLN